MDKRSETKRIRVESRVPFVQALDWNDREIAYGTAQHVADELERYAKRLKEQAKQAEAAAKTLRRHE